MLKKPINVTIVKQGTIEIDTFRSSRNAMIVYIDAKTLPMFTELDIIAEGENNGVPLIHVCIIRYTPHGDVIKHNESTVLEFPSLRGWKLWMSEATRYNIKLCFIKNTKKSSLC